MVKYNEISQLIQNLSDYINYIIGLIYSFGILITAIFIKIITDQTASIVTRIFCLVLLIALCIVCYMVNIMSASISTANKSFAKHLYPIFIEKHFRNLRLKFKIDGFIARLNNQFIGFYCFNLFKFTKLAFYQFFYILTSAYILVNNLSID